MKRAIERSKLDRETNIELVETMWKQFSNLGIYELNVIDTTTHSIKDTVSAVQEKIASKRTTLVEESELTHVAAPDNPTKEFENRQERFALYRAMQQLDAETREVIHKKYILCVLKLAAVSASHCTLVIKAILTNLFTKTLYISNIELYLANF